MLIILDEKLIVEIISVFIWSVNLNMFNKVELFFIIVVFDYEYLNV